ncbi:hypothetical protein [Streptomyces roseolilacinus]|uniref:Uncharacterized protein n=1 Tax=Streptomyces roseolilacinus TaxID=66904 RepID=A0A918AYF9_9ACTN|nr:hypothetical protein [Streptomyces roseolilacinus]GGQ01638.1 hypothetical protein GCM10010249_20120 [Streptomyces roseolilacinus]
MVRKKREGDQDQRREAALEVERAGEQPSGRGTTTGVSKQRMHKAASASHEERTATPHRGEQRSASRE